MSKVTEHLVARQLTHHLDLDGAKLLPTFQSAYRGMDIPLKLILKITSDIFDATDSTPVKVTLYLGCWTSVLTLTSSTTQFFQLV